MAIVLIDLYRGLFSNFLAVFLGVHCRFSPTCSCYAREAIRIYGIRKGSIKSVKRLMRCHPWGRHGHDPVKDEEALNSGT